jgi:hypothetical protein
VLSLTVLGRKGRVLLAAPSQEIAAELERKISSRLQPASITTNLGSETTLSVSSNSERIRSYTTSSINGRFGWHLDFQPQADCWRGWLLKRGRGPLASWQRRWFELRRQPTPPAVAAAGGSRIVAALHYSAERRVDSDGGPEQRRCRPAETRWKRLDVAAVRREPGLDGAAGAVLSVDVPGRRGRTLLAALSAAEAEELVRALEWRLLYQSAAAAAASPTSRPSPPPPPPPPPSPPPSSRSRAPTVPANPPPPPLTPPPPPSPPQLPTFAVPAPAAPEGGASAPPAHGVWGESPGAAGALRRVLRCAGAAAAMRRRLRAGSGPPALPVREQAAARDSESERILVGAAAAV